MFNNNLLLALGLLYFCNLIVLFIVFYLVITNKIIFYSKYQTYLLYTLCFIISGVPPFSLFFFKLILIISSSYISSNIIILLFLISNTPFIYFYYKNFKIFFFTKLDIFIFKKKALFKYNIENIYRILYVYILLNIFSLFFLDLLVICIQVIN